MQSSSILLYNGLRYVDYEPYPQTWHDSSSYDDAGLSGEPLSYTQDASYDDTYYLTYEDYPSRLCYKNGGTNQDHRGNETPHSISGTCLGDYTRYFGCYWGESDVVYPEEGYGSSLEKEESYEDQYGNCFNHKNNMQPDYSENQWLGYGGLDFGGGSAEGDIDGSDYSSSWDNWEETMMLCERIFGH